MRNRIVEPDSPWFAAFPRFVDHSYMSLAQLTSPTAVMMAIEECDRLGSEEFLRAYGFTGVETYLFIFGNTEYASTAIAGVAFGYQYPEVGPLKAGQFTPGKEPNGAARRLYDLGFDHYILHRKVTDWNLHQCHVVAKAYFECLHKKLAGESFNRTAVLNRVADQIDKPRGSVDFKFQNIDAILFKAGLPRLNNAVSKNAQKLLEYVVLDPLAQYINVLENAPAQPGELPLGVSQKTTPVAIDILEPEVEGGTEAPGRISCQTYRILRDTRLCREVKDLHEDKCQLCGTAIILLNGETYSEAHHIIPLGEPHNGPDVAGNILVVCPNHHAMLDFRAIMLDRSTIRIHPRHPVSEVSISYHNANIGPS